MDQKQEENYVDDDMIMGLDEDIDNLIYLSSSEGTVFSLKKKDALISVLITSFIEGDHSAGSTEDYPITLKQVNTKNLELIVEYMTFHEGKDEDIQPQPVRSTDMKKVCQDPRDAVFCDKLITKDSTGNADLNLLFEIIMSSNYMDMKALLYKLCAKVATQLKGKKLEDIPKILKNVTRYENDEHKE